jgi:hypothetical protein
MYRMTAVQERMLHGRSVMACTWDLEESIHLPVCMHAVEICMHPQTSVLNKSCTLGPNAAASAIPGHPILVSHTANALPLHPPTALHRRRLSTPSRTCKQSIPRQLVHPSPVVYIQLFQLVH